MPVDRVLIVGGGIAGLATAAGLARSGIECEIVERTPQWAPVGAGIVMSVNAMSVMRGLGIADDIADVGVVLGRAAITDAKGLVLGENDFETLRPEYGPTIALHRAALHAVLLEAASDVPISLSTSVASIVQHPDHVDVVLTNGREERFGLHVLAIGRRVPGRSSRHARNVGTGFAIRARADPEHGRLARFGARFAGFGGQVPEVIAALERPEELIHNDVEEIPQCPWFDRRVVLLGDAAHAMTPNMGQGAAMALEDSAVLVELLSEPKELAQQLALWVARREPRVRWVQNQSRRIGRVGQLAGAIGCPVRNAVLRMTPNRVAASALRKIASQPI